MHDYLEIIKNSKEFKVIKSNDENFWAKYQNDEWEQDLFNLFDKIQNKDIKSFIDVGASDGPITIYNSYDVFQTISIEPENNCFERLKKNILLNDIKNVHCLHGALGLSDKKTIFETGNEFSDIMFLSDEDESGYQIDVFELSSIIKKYKIGKFILKIDIEGYEFDLLDNINFFKLISENKPEFFLAIHLGCSSLFKYKIAKYNFLQRFYNLTKTFSEYKIIYRLLKQYKYVYIEGQKVSKLFFLNKKYYRKNLDMFLTNETLKK